MKNSFPEAIEEIVLLYVLCINVLMMMMLVHSLSCLVRMYCCEYLAYYRVSPGIRDALFRTRHRKYNTRDLRVIRKSGAAIYARSVFTHKRAIYTRVPLKGVASI